MTFLRQAFGGHAGLVNRLRAMSANEVSWRLRTQIRTRAQEAATAVRASGWRREDIRHALAVETLPASLQEAIAGGDWLNVHRGLAQTLRERRSRFVLQHSRSRDIQREIQVRWPNATTEAVDRAAAIRQGTFDLLGYRALSFQAADRDGIDWHFDPVHRRRMPMAFWSRVPYLDPSSGDHKIVWELNRQQHWLALGRALWLTGDASYARDIVRDLQGWLTANPPLVGANWASMLELAFRSLSWLWGLHAILAEPHAFADDGSAEAGGEPWLVDLMVALDRQLTHVEANLSTYFSPNTHLTGEALGLYVAGAALPELAASGRWLDTGRAVLLNEIDRQIEPDGGHAERSTHYHRYTLDFYLLALLTARRIGDSDGESRFAEAVSRLAPFTRAMADGQGRLPRIGDDDGGQLWPIAGRDSADVRDSLALAAVTLDRPEWAPWGLTEEVLWLTSNDGSAFTRALSLVADDRRVRERRNLLVFPGTGRHQAVEDRRRLRRDRRATPEAQPVRVNRRVTSVFPDTGYVTSATAAGDHLVVDAGPHGYLNGGHAHADALAVVLTLRHKPLLVDAGTPTYTMDATLRDVSRSSSSHNTLTIDGRSVAEPNGPFHWRTRADGRLELLRHNSRLCFIEAAHDAYGEVGHRRVVFATDHGYLFVDHVTGDGRHESAQHWHFDPRWRVGCEAPGVLRLLHDTGDTAWLVHDRGAMQLRKGDSSSQIGWVSPAYGVRVPAWALRITDVAAAPSALVTWCGSSPDGAIPTLERVACESDAAMCVATRVRCGTSDTITVVRPGDTVARETRTARALGVETDGRALQCGFDEGVLESIALVDGRAVRVSDAFGIEADAVMPDLHVTIRNRRIELETSAPAAHLTLTGTALRDVTVVSGNGRTLRRLDGSHAATIVLSAPDWSAPATGIEFQDQVHVRYRRVR